jgi:RNA polymerase sigma factor (sigma-70 family)
MDDDSTLLHRYARTRDDTAFATLLRRHVDLVYSVALRRTHGDAHLAADVSQQVFLALARRAAALARHPSLLGWLHTCACRRAADLVRSEARRRARETVAAIDASIVPEPRAQWEILAPELDLALQSLRDRDREIILQRYFAQKPFADIGVALGVSDAAAQMRAARALEKLRRVLAGRGVTSTASALGLALGSNAVAAAPASVATSTLAALASSTAVVTAATGAGIFTLMSTTTKVIVAGVVIAAAGLVVRDLQTTRRLERDFQTLRSENNRLTARAHDLERQITDLRKRSETAVIPAASSSASSAPPSSTAKPASVPRPGITPKAPSGWSQNGSNLKAYEVGVDQNVMWGGMPSAYVRSISDTDEPGFGGMMQTLAVDEFRGARVRLNGWIKIEDVSDGAQLWMRVDGKERGGIQFDNMQNRAPKGTKEWEEYSVVLDVPESAAAINYGFFVNGKGRMWVNGLVVEKVGSDVPSTNLDFARTLPKTPQNLGFSPK